MQVPGSHGCAGFPAAAGLASKKRARSSFSSRQLRRPELPGALGAVAKATEARTGQKGSARSPSAALTSEVQTEAERSAPKATPKLGVLYAAWTYESFARDRMTGSAEEVVYDAIWIRREPNAKGDKLTKRSRTAKSKVRHGFLQPRL